MSKTGTPYPTEVREQIVALHRAGRSIGEMAQAFETCTATIHGSVKHADHDGGRQADILSSVEREELRRLRRKNKQLKRERDILSKAAAASFSTP